MTPNSLPQKLKKLITSHPGIGMRLTLSIGLIITLTIVLLFVSIYQNEKEQHLKQLHAQAEALLSEMTVARAWVASYNGVWTKTPGDYYLDAENGYYQKSPAMVTKELSTLSNAQGEYRFHITSLILTNPTNAPDIFEHNALIQFEEQAEPIASLDKSGSEPVYRLMMPLKVQESCLECHASQGYQVGDIRGGLSVLVPTSEMDASLAKSRRVLTFSAISIVGLVMSTLYIMVRKMVISPVSELKKVAIAVGEGNYDIQSDLHTGDELEVFSQTFNQMVVNLKVSQASLEERVIQRTQELNTISEIALIISRAGELESVLHEALEKVLTISKATGGFVQVFDGKRTRIVAHAALSPSVIQCFQHVQQQNEPSELENPIQVKEIQAQVCRTLYPSHQCLEKNGCKANVAGYTLLSSVLLRSRSRSVGRMILFSAEESSFSPEIMQLLESIGNQLGVAIENANFQQRVEEVAILEERTRISRELHDSLAQTLGWLSIKTELLEEDLMLGAVEKSNAEIKTIRNVVRDACYDVRESIDDLRTDPSGNLSATAAAWIANFRQRSGLVANFHAGDIEVPLAPVVEMELLRILQEALTNVRKHAQATQVQVDLNIHEGFLTLTVEDNGTGFDHDQAETAGHFGLRIMQERAERLGGDFEIKGAPQTGTLILVKLPPFPTTRAGWNTAFS